MAAQLGFIDGRDQSYWYSDGTSGSVTVEDAGGGALDIFWTDATIYYYLDTTITRTSSAGWLHCTPEE